MQVLCIRSRVGTAAVLRQRAGKKPEAPWVPPLNRCLSNTERRGSAHVHCKLCQWRAVQTQRYDFMLALAAVYGQLQTQSGVSVCVCVFFLSESLVTCWGVRRSDFARRFFVNATVSLLLKALTHLLFYS